MGGITVLAICQLYPVSTGRYSLLLLTTNTEFHPTDCADNQIMMLRLRVPQYHCTNHNRLIPACVTIRRTHLQTVDPTKTLLRAYSLCTRQSKVGNNIVHLNAMGNIPRRLTSSVAPPRLFQLKN